MKTSIELMMESLLLKNQAYLIRLISHDINNSRILSKISEGMDRKSLVEFEFDFTGHSIQIGTIVLEIIGFSNKLIDNEVGELYSLKIGIASEKLKLKCSYNYLIDLSMDIYFELTNLVKLSEKKLLSKISNMKLNESE